MQKIRGILRVGFEIAFLVIISFGTFLRITRAAERVPPRAAKTAGKHPDHLGDGGGVVERIIHTSSKGMPRHAHRRWALMLDCGRQLECCGISLMCKFHIKSYHMSNSQNCLSLILEFSTFIRIYVSAYVVENMLQFVFRRQESKFKFRSLYLKVNGRKILLRKVMTRKIMTS